MGVVCHTTQNYFVDVVVDIAVKAHTTSEKSQHFEVEEKLPKRYFWRNNSGEERGEDGGGMRSREEKRGDMRGARGKVGKEEWRRV